MQSPEQCFTTKLLNTIVLGMNLFFETFLLHQLTTLDFAGHVITASPLDQLCNAHHGALVSHDRITHCGNVGGGGRKRKTSYMIK